VHLDGGGSGDRVIHWDGFVGGCATDVVVTITYETLTRISVCVPGACPAMRDESRLT